MGCRFVLASDIGSGGCKTIVTDMAGRVLAAAQREYPSHYPRPGWVEQNPQDWYRAFCETVRMVMDGSGIGAEGVAAVCIVGVTHNCVLIDERDRPVCPSILMFDIRSRAQAHRILARWGDVVHQKTFNDTNSTWSWPQLMWIRENRPEPWRACRRILFAKDYVRHRLAPSYVTDYIDASGTLLFDPMRGRWIEPFCDDLGLEMDRLPGVVSPCHIVSRVGAEGARDTGLAQGTPVVAGTTDTAAEVLGAGAVTPGSATMKLASVGRIALVTRGPAACHHVFNYRHVLDGLWYPGTASKYAASAYRWLRDILWPGARDGTAYPRMDKEAGGVPLGSEGLIFHPHLMGEWAPFWNDKMRGDFLGLTARHGRPHLIRSVLEGVSFALKDALSELESVGLAVEEIRLIGQGSKSRLWAQIVADVIDRQVLVPEQVDAVYGAALVAIMGVGEIESSPQQASSMVRTRESFTPDPGRSSAYQRLFGIYREADAALMSVSQSLHDFVHGAAADAPR